MVVDLDCGAGDSAEGAAAAEEAVAAAEARIVATGAAMARCGLRNLLCDLWLQGTQVGGSRSSQETVAYTLRFVSSLPPQLFSMGTKEACGDDVGGHPSPL